MKWFTTISIAAFAALSMAQNVTVSIHRVKQIDDLDKPTFGITKDRADFKAQIWIDGKLWTSKTFSKDDGRPYWKFTAPASKVSTIRIKLIDDDGGLERKDDYVDINKSWKKKDLNMKYNKATGRISGDMKGYKGQILHSFGSGDSSQGAIWFSIQ